jgi:hypoxanthine phosphoribosyltransferase
MTAEKQTDLYVSWDEYHKKIEELAIKVYQDGYDFSQIVCIAKGGLRVGDIFARLFDKPLAILSVESYRGDGVKNEQGSMTFSRDLAQTTPNLGSRVILVDDLADSGITLEKPEVVESFLRILSRRSPHRRALDEKRFTVQTRLLRRLS